MINPGWYPPPWMVIEIFFEDFEDDLDYGRILISPWIDLPFMSDEEVEQEFREMEQARRETSR